MSHHFSPSAAPDRPCWHCTRFVGMLYQGSAAACRLPHGPRVRPLPGRGCAHWVREPGADDEAGPPAATDRRVACADVTDAAAADRP